MRQGETERYREIQRQRHRDIERAIDRERQTERDSAIECLTQRLRARTMEGNF